LWCIGRVYAF